MTAASDKRDSPANRCPRRLGFLHIDHRGLAGPPPTPQFVQVHI
jgi:hypothetical protein